MFDKVNVRLRSRSFNIIKGTSGIGKTSLINILLGYIKLESGNIYLGETDINSIDIKEFRNNISYISQNVEIFYDTLRNNIKMYIDKNIDDLEILKALQSVGLEKYTKNIKDSLDSMILSDGKNISGGEAQRIVLCRALVQNRSIIILDEVTANLDKKTEKEIISCIKTLFTNKTVVIITHSNEFDDIVDNIIDLNKIKKLEKIH